MKTWLKKFWKWLVAGVVGLALLAGAIAKLVFDRQEKKSEDKVKETLERQVIEAHQDSTDATTASVHAEGVEQATENAIVDVIETTQPGSEERLDGLVDSLNTMRRRHEAAKK